MALESYPHRASGAVTRLSEDTREHRCFFLSDDLFLLLALVRLFVIYQSLFWI